MTGQMRIFDAAAGWWRISWRMRGEVRTDLVDVATQGELDRHVAGLRIRGAVQLERPRLHTCAACDKTAPWGVSWVWYGSVRDLDEGRPIVKLCSVGCAADAKHRRLVPRNASFLAAT